jgi:hypothetical protein
MLLSESDAKFKYCPLLKTKDDKMKFCLGSMCMLWRWADLAKAGADEEGYCGAAGSIAVAAAAAMGAVPEADSKPIADY